MKWLIDLFKEDRNELHNGTSDLSSRVIEIKARIASFKSSRGWSQISSTDTSTPTEPVVAKKESDITQSDSTDIKAKLLAIKK